MIKKQNLNNKKSKEILFLYPGSFKPPHIGHFSIIETILEKYENSKIIIFISKKDRYLPISNIPISASFSKKLWEKWISFLPSSNKNKIQIKIAYFPSPIMDVVYYAKKYKKNHIHNIVYFIKSSKNKEDNRFKKIIEQDKNFKEWIIEPIYPEIHSRDIRQKINEIERMNEKEFLKYFKYFFFYEKKNKIGEFYKLFSNYFSNFIKK